MTGNSDSKNIRGPGQNTSRDAAVDRTPRFDDEGYQDGRGGRPHDTDWIHSVLLSDHQQRVREAETDRILAAGRQTLAEENLKRAEVELASIPPLNWAESKVRKSSLLLGLTFIAAGLVFALSDVAISLETVARVLILPDTPMFGVSWLPEDIVFAMALGTIGLVLSVFFYSFVVRPFVEHRLRSGDSAAERRDVRNPFRTIPISSTVFISIACVASLLIVGWGAYLRAQAVLPIQLEEPTSFATDDAYQEELTNRTAAGLDERDWRAESALQKPGVRRAAVTMMVGVSVVFAINAGLCLALGLVFLRGFWREAMRKWTVYLSSSSVKGRGKKRQIGQLESKLQSAKEDCVRVSVAQDHLQDLFKAELGSAEAKYTRGYVWGEMELAARKTAAGAAEAEQQ